MTNKSKKRTRRTEPVEAPPPQRTRPNTPEPNPVATELTPSVLSDLNTTLRSTVRNLWENIDFSPDSELHVPIHLGHTLFHTYIDNFISLVNDEILQRQKNDHSCLTPLPPYSDSRAATPVPPPPPVPRSDAAVQTDQETQPDPPPLRSYAQAATMTEPEAIPKAPPPPPRHPHPRSRTHNPTSRPPDTLTPDTPNPAIRSSPKMMGQRVVIHIGKSTFLSARLGVPAVLPKLHKDISDALEQEGEAPKCLGVKLSQSRNLVITFPAKSSKSAIAAAFPTLRNTLLLPQSVRLSFDTPWSFVSFANVPTRLSPDDTPFSTPELLQEVRNNPALRELAFTRIPSWVSDPKHLTKSRSSIAFAFEDPTGSLLKKIKQSECFMFGTSIRIRDWSPRPTTAQPRPAFGQMDTST